MYYLQEVNRREIVVISVCYKGHDLLDIFYFYMM
jgi:hypothetical protein